MNFKIICQKSLHKLSFIVINLAINLSWFSHQLQFIILSAASQAQADTSKYILQNKYTYIQQQQKKRGKNNICGNVYYKLPAN